MTEKAYKDIINDADVLYKNIRTIGENGMTSKKAYYFGESVLHPKKNIKKVPIAAAPNARGKKTGINIKLKKKEYIERINHVNEFIRTKKRMPNFVTIHGVNVNMDIWNAYVGYLCKVQHDTGKLPDAQRIKSDIYQTEKLHDYLTNEGCDGMGQCTAWNCACNALQQQFYRLTGILVPESKIAGWAGTTEEGTDHPGINTAVAMFNKVYKKNVKITWYNFGDLGKNSKARWEAIKNFLKKGGVFFHLCYRGPDGVGHYEGIQSVGDTLRILNSLGDRCNYPAYCGYVETRERSTQEWYISGISQKSVAVLMNG